jgi:hypothetical protein
MMQSRVCFSGGFLGGFWVNFSLFLPDDDGTTVAASVGLTVTWGCFIKAFFPVFFVNYLFICRFGYVLM